jgi:hypothetical protein
MGDHANGVVSARKHARTTTQQGTRTMKTYTNLIDWLNDEPRTAPVMQRDDVFGLLSWSDMRHNANVAKALSFRTFGWMLIVGVGVPVLLMV